jgi:gamma-glutamylcyclotransferase (GGCT)/AIG2-like uncharacterized protein YtfP
MPRLRHPVLIKGKAVSYLVDIYRNDEEFVKDLDEMRRPYLPVLFGLADSTLDFWAECKSKLSQDDYWAVIEFYQGKSEQMPSLDGELEDRRSLMEQLWMQLQPYAKALLPLTNKWKLRSVWAIPILIYCDIFDLMAIMGLPTEIDVPIGSVVRLYPLPISIPDLEIAISPWVFFISDKGQIQKEIAQKLSDYQNKIKSSGFHEFPSALKKHARWWFEHYVHRKTYDEIAQMEVYTPGDTPIIYARNVGEAVRRFSNLIGIKPNALK